MSAAVVDVRRRRPSGEPPPLPRSQRLAPAVWTLAAVLVVGAIVTTVGRAADSPPTAGEGILGWFADRRSSGLTSVAKVFDWLTTFTVIMAMRVAVAVALLAFRRIRHMVVFLATLVVTDWIVTEALSVPLPKPSVAFVTSQTYSFPSRPVSALAITLCSAAFVLVPAGRARRSALAVVGGVLALVVLSGLYLATGYPFAMAYSAVLAFAVSAAAFRWLTPEDAFPVRYGTSGPSAHLDLSGERGHAVVSAMADQLGLTVTKVEPFGLEGSGGSSPLRMTLEDGTRVFGKIYSTGHVRSDRWYRIGRTLLYGRLEDETPIGSVRRLATSEDYALRFLQDQGVPVAKPYGVVELTPNAEYMIVMEFFEGAKNLGDSDINDQVIDEGVALVRTFWDAGVAHRDVKPANLLVRDGHLQLVDVSALEIRPSPWRQAVDLANMLLTLALRTDADRVYERATRVFTPDDVAEGLAASQGPTIPSELARRMKEDGRPLLERFRELAPSRPAVSVQRWSARRLVFIGLALVGTVALVTLFVESLRAGLT
ncbi:MAG TPA: RIO1 family regulatory kinase/ATPase [Actinomycetota bacterium]|nr:RIO1 family regulatory kinase/ATPase [Actinomycetota bacterium]